ncbi:hypothetical protein T08_9628 [Trichinella sp. T8]|nr:hypothetical protein T08_9628 [Trichinella sp. T8]
MVNDYLCPYKSSSQEARTVLLLNTIFNFKLPFCSYMIHIKQPVNHEWSADDIVQDECTMQSM